MPLAYDHVGARVPDLGAALAWYRDKLDFRLMASTEALGLTWAMIAPADHDDFMIEHAAGRGAGEHPYRGQLDERLGMLGWHHTCLRVASVDNSVAELKSRGMNIINFGTAGAESVPSSKPPAAVYAEALARRAPR